MSDWHDNEREKMNGFKPSAEGTPDMAEEEHTVTDNYAPMMDWSQHIDLGEVKDVFFKDTKDVCKADWAYSCVNAFEAALAIANKKDGSPKA